MDSNHTNVKPSYDALYLRSYRKWRPDKAEQWRINSEIRHLRKLGYTVIAPVETIVEPEDMTTEELESHLARYNSREYAKQWRESNREHIREYQRKYRETHRAEIAESNRKSNAKWRNDNPELVKAYAKRWREANPEKVREYQKRWLAKNPHYGRVRYARQKARYQQMQQEYNARIREYVREQKQQNGGER